MEMRFGRYSIALVTISALFFATLFVCGLVLSAGTWNRSMTFTGPFNKEAGTHMYYVTIAPPLRPIFDSGGDSNNRPFRSDLTLSVDGEIWTRAHTMHADLRSNAERAYSHWGNDLMFTPSAGVTPSRVDLTYEVHVDARIMNALGALSFLLIGLRVAIAFITGSGQGAIRLFVIAWMRTALWMSWALAGLAVCYFVSICIAAFLGYAMPTSAIFDWLPGGGYIERALPLAAIPILLICGVGTFCGWASQFKAIEKDEYQAYEWRLIRFWSFAALPVVVAFLLAATSAGGWNGNVDQDAMSYQSIGGLVPHSDAQAYYFSTFDMLSRGGWSAAAAQRPLAAAMRGMMTLGGGLSYVGSIIIQTLVISGILVLALRAFVISEGIWVAGAFLGLAYGVLHPFLTTTLTEPLGVAWTLLSLAFFIEALRTRSAPHALVGFAAMCLALMTRMGSMFTIPFLMIWIVIAFARTWRRAFQLTAAVSGILAFAIILNFWLIYVFAPNAELGGNFSYVACGLARGTNWSECPSAFREQFDALHDVASRNRFLYMQAFEAFKANPHILLQKASANIGLYVTNIPKILLTQYTTVFDLSAFRASIYACFCIPGLILVAARRSFDLTFWLTIFASTVVSAALIFGDDGRRVLIVTYVFLAGVFALGFASPSAVRRIERNPSISWHSGVGGILAVLSLFVIANLALLMNSNRTGSVATGAGKESQHQVLGRLGTTGFLVVPDGAIGDPKHVTVEYSKFVMMWEGSALQIEFGPLNKKAIAHLPFAFVASPRTDGRDQNSLLIGPPEILLNRKIREWSLEVSKISDGGPLFLVDKASVIQRR